MVTGIVVPNHSTENRVDVIKKTPDLLVRPFQAILEYFHLCSNHRLIRAISANTCRNRRVDGDDDAIRRISLGLGHSVGVSRTSRLFGDRTEHDLRFIRSKVYACYHERYQPSVHGKALIWAGVLF